MPNLLTCLFTTAVELGIRTGTSAGVDAAADKPPLGVFLRGKSGIVHVELSHRRQTGVHANQRKRRRGIRYKNRFRVTTNSFVPLDRTNHDLKIGPRHRVEGGRGKIPDNILENEPGEKRMDRP